MNIRALAFLLSFLVAVTATAVACGGGDDDDDDDEDDASESECVSGCVDNGDGTMACDCLLWKTDDSGEALTWDEARDWAEGLEFAGRTGWRLAAVDELNGLYDSGNEVTATNGYTAYIMDPFTVTLTDIWSGDLDPANDANAQYVSFSQVTGPFTGTIIRGSTGLQSAIAVLDLE